MTYRTTKERSRAHGKLQPIKLNAQESRAFAEALLCPREPSPRLRAAARRYLLTAPSDRA